jgi:hypothetical protein
MKYQVQHIAGMKSSAPTIYVSVELQVLSFFLVELTMGNPRPKDSLPPECPYMLGRTANDVSTHYFMMSLPFALRISGIVWLPLRYIIKCTILVQSSLSGACTLVVKNSMAVQESNMARLVAYKVLATRLWKSTSLSCLSFSQLSSTFKRLSGAVLVFVPSYFAYALSKAAMILLT